VIWKRYKLCADLLVNFSRGFESDCVFRTAPLRSSSANVYMYCLINEQECFIIFKMRVRSTSIFDMKKTRLQIFWIASNTTTIDYRLISIFFIYKECWLGWTFTVYKELIDWLIDWFKTRDLFHKLEYVLFNGDVYLC
jgi:hypothetical protein